MSYDKEWHKNYYNKNKKNIIKHANNWAKNRRKAKAAELEAQGDNVGRWLCEQICERPNLHERYTKSLNSKCRPVEGPLDTPCLVMDQGGPKEYPCLMVCADGVSYGMKAHWVAAALQCKVPPLVNPEKLERSHLCHNRKCCNGDHIEIETPEENKQRGGMRADGTVIQGKHAGGRPKL